MGVDHTVADRLGAHEREQDVVVLLSLELVGGRDLGGHAVQVRAAAPLVGHVGEQVLLPVVCGDDRDFRGRDALCAAGRA